MYKQFLKKYKQLIFKEKREKVKMKILKLN